MTEPNDTKLRKNCKWKSEENFDFTLKNDKAFVNPENCIAWTDIPLYSGRYVNLAGSLRG